MPSAPAAGVRMPPGRENPPEGRWCLIAVDVKHFKLFKELNGQEKGDQLLVRFAEILHDAAHAAGGLSCYRGQDDYALFFPYDRIRIDRLFSDLRSAIDSLSGVSGFFPIFGISPIDGEGNGTALDLFNQAALTAEEINAAFGNDHSVDISTMMHIDSLLNTHGCDSLIILTLYIVNENVDINSQISTLSTDVKIYPNPTRGMVTVEGSELLSVEVYDNISRRILTRTSDGKESIMRFDMSQQASGSYYIRVKTNNGTVVKKLIKK